MLNGKGNILPVSIVLKKGSKTKPQEHSRYTMDLRTCSYLSLLSLCVAEQSY